MLVSICGILQFLWWGQQPKSTENSQLAEWVAARSVFVRRIYETARRQPELEYGAAGATIASMSHENNATEHPRRKQWGQE